MFFNFKKRIISYINNRRTAMNKIQKYSRRVRHILQFLFIIIPIATVYYWLTIQTDSDFLIQIGLIEPGQQIQAFTQAPLTLSTRLWALLASLLPCGVVMYALNQLIALFRRYEQADIFSVLTVSYYQKLGYVFFYWALASFIYRGLISVALSFNNPPGERVLTLSFGSMDLMVILCGFVVLIISWVMKEAQKIADEHMHTI